jgi:hypothetical protein
MANRAIHKYYDVDKKDKGVREMSEYLEILGALTLAVLGVVTLLVVIEIIKKWCYNTIGRYTRERYENEIKALKERIKELEK